MSDIWEDRFRTDSLWAAVEDLQLRVTAVKPIGEADHDAALLRLKWFVSTLESHLEDGEPNRYTPTMLNNMQRQVEGTVAPGLMAYDPGVDAAALVRIAISLDTALDQLATWPALNPKGAAQAAGKAWSEYADAAVAAVGTLGAETDALRARVASVEVEVADERAALSTLRADLEARLGEEIERKGEETANRLVTETQRQRDDVAAAKTEAEVVLAEVKTVGAETSKVSAAFARRTVATSYQKNARNKAIAGWVWDIIGALVAGVPLTIMLWHYLQEPIGAGDDTALALTRIGVSIAAVGLATLCFHRGTENHRESRRSKRADIRIRTVYSFLANQDPEVRDAVLEGMADRIYLQGILDEDASTYSDSLLQTYIAKVRDRRARAIDGDEA